MSNLSNLETTESERAYITKIQKMSAQNVKDLIGSRNTQHKKDLEAFIIHGTKKQKEEVLNNLLNGPNDREINFAYKLIARSSERLEISNLDIIRLWGQFIHSADSRRSSVILQKYGIIKSIQGVLEFDFSEVEEQHWSEKQKTLTRHAVKTIFIISLVTHYLLLSPAIVAATTLGVDLAGTTFVNLVSKEKHVNKLITKCEDILLKNKLSKGLGLDKIKEGVNKLNQIIAKDNKLMKAVHNIINGNDALKKVKDIIGPILPAPLQAMCSVISAMVVLALATLVKHKFILPEKETKQLG
jgi:hypothetical protein